MSKKLDMGFGNPFFLQNYWTSKKIGYYLDDLSYGEKGNPYLKESIKELHRQTMNAVVDSKHIVIGNGASQIIQALIAILNKPVYARPPYFSRFPIFTKNVGKIWLTNEQYKYAHITQPVEIITLPNNPDNSKNLSRKSKTVIYDLSYNWPQYTEVSNLDAEVMVFSLAKATGHASTRIGWVIIKNKRLAKEVEAWIENNTSGVSKEAQLHALHILEEDVIYTKGKIFKYGKKILDKRWEEINKRTFPFKVINESGMFLWCRGLPPKDIININGKEFGSSKKHFRLNIGCSNKIFKEFLKYGRLKKSN